MFGESMKNHTFLMKIEKQNCEHLEKSQVPLGPPGWASSVQGGRLLPPWPRTGLRILSRPALSTPISQDLLLSILIFSTKYPDADLPPLSKARRGSKMITEWKKLSYKK